MRGANQLAGGFFGDPTVPSVTAAERGSVAPNTQPTGALTGVPPATRFANALVPPAGGATPAIQLVPPTRENRFVTLNPPLVAFLIYIAGDAGVSLANGMPLPPGLPYEVSLPGGQSLWAVTDAPTFLRLRVQIACAMAGERERRLGSI